MARAQPRGALVDRATQRWVRATGRRAALGDHPWLDGPVGDVDRIGMDFFARFAERRGWQVIDRGNRDGEAEQGRRQSAQLPQRGVC